MDEETSGSENRQHFSTIDDSTNVCTNLEYNSNIQNTDLDDFEGVKRCLSQNINPLTTKPIDQEDEIYFTTTEDVTKHLQINDNKTNSETAENEDYEEEHLIFEEYSCQLCLKSFQGLEALKSHVSDHCLARNNSNSVLIEKNDCSDDEIDDSCLQNYEFETKIENEDISVENECIDSLISHSCDESFVNLEERLQRAERRLSINGLKCRYCERSFLKLSSRNYHEESIHGSRNDKSHKCDECGKEFGKKSELKYHSGSHNQIPATCSICHKHFRTAQSFKMHLKRHTLGSRYNCTDCGKSYYTNSELARHVQQHSGLREFPCDLCDMSFLSKPELNRHVKYHNGVKKFECKICRKTYYESGHLKVHERVHTGERPFVCTVCKKGFITKAKLARHFKTHDKTKGAQRDSLNICEQYRLTK